MRLEGRRRNISLECIQKRNVPSFTHSGSTHYAPGMFWVPRSGSEQDRQGPCSLVTQAGEEMVDKEAYEQTR